MSVEAPERIWATVNGASTRLPDGARQLIGGWSEDRHRPSSVEYVRADIFQRLKDQRNDWQSVAQHAGVCMTCAISAPEPYGCTDCLNTGWDGGSPAGFVRADKLEELKAENERLRGDCRAYEKTMQAIAEAENTAIAERDKEIAALREALEFYANPIVYAPHPHGPAFDRRDLSFMAKNVLARNAGGNDD